MQLEAGCQIHYHASEPTPCIFMLRPRSGYGQWIMSEEYVLAPKVPILEYTDFYGNLCQRLVIPAGDFQVRTVAQVETADEIDVQPGAPYLSVENLPESVLLFLLPSRYCQSDQLGQLALEIAGAQAPGYDQVSAICDWIHTQIEYQYGTSNASTSAVETAQSRQGVCRDFAHLGIALCRSLNIPARMVVGYLYELDPMDLHAWFEAYVGGQWFTFDATQAQPRGNRVTLAYGRDAADVALATQFGLLQLQEMKVWVKAVST
ncbi:transglutaminase family protein [Synechococcales cyanobacterium C]|uniref:Transglutaminase family protein n=1 Tax=Petrachloros mirabilis ULC683 TaxID=2781853 RepID=A0A8K2A2M2_9CYAN|nr:transglutaminase family protein [Petrachloros mirabilis]NCJ08757.1 transglutaminase family protein [Petrachloros mirabilis ULC683]